MNKALSALLAALLLFGPAHGLLAQAFPDAPAAAVPAVAQWMDNIEYQSVDGTWRDASLHIESDGVSLYRDRGGRFPLVTLTPGAYVDDSRPSKRRWLRTALVGAATAVGTWTVWRFATGTRQDTDAQVVFDPTLPDITGKCYPHVQQDSVWHCPDEKYRRNWAWGGTLAGGGLLTWLTSRGKAWGRGSITVSGPDGQVRLRTSPQRRHDALAMRLRQVLESATPLSPFAPEEDALHAYPLGFVDGRSNPAGTQWIR